MRKYAIISFTGLVLTGFLFAQSLDNINTRYNEFAPSLSPDDSFMVFSSKRDHDKYMDIYISQNENGEWSKPIKLQALNSPYNDESPFISSDGKIIVFSSDRDGSFEMPKNDKGQIRVSYDLYVSFLEDGQWSRPKKIPGAVNTMHHERAPSLSRDKKTLYFTRWEFGNVDSAAIMYSKFEDGKFTEPVAFPSPINTEYIEVALVPDQMDRGFFFSSARPGGFGSLDLYYVSHRDGEFGIPVNLGEQINSPQAEAYFTVHNGALYYCSNREGGKGDFDIYFDRIPSDFFIRFLMVDKEKNEPVSGEIKLEIPGEKGLSELAKKTDENGRLLLPWKERPEYIDIFIEKEGFLPYYKRLYAVEYPEGAFRIELTPLKKESSFTISSIYFDYNSDVIKEESYIYLDKLAEYLKKHKNIKLQIIGHTDLHGTAEFNLKLSIQRAEAVASYLMKKGVEKHRLSTNGAGMTKPAVNEISPKADRLNRRTEFKVIDIDNNGQK